MKVDKFILPVDFVILDCEVDADMPIILSKPFLATRRALVNVETGDLMFKVNDKDMLFNICKIMKQS